MTSERGGIIGGFIIKMAFLFALVGVMLYEAGAIIVARVSVDGIAIDASKEAALTYDQTDGSLKDARRECNRLARAAGADCIELEVRDGVAYATIRKQAPTLFAHRIGGLKRFAVAETEQGAAVP